MSDVFHRKRVASGVKTVERIHVLLSLMSHRVGRLLEAIDVQPKRKMTTLDPDNFDDDVEEIAREVRRAWSIPSGPITNLTKLVESAGIFVFRVDLDTPHVSGVSQWADGVAPIIFINASVPADRYRFTLAHELGHLFMHAGNFRESGLIETEADRFAAELLMPKDEILPDLTGRLTLDRAAALKPYWRASMGALIKRAHDTGCIATSQHRNLRIQMSKRGWHKVEPTSIDQEHPRLARRVLQAYLGSGIELDAAMVELVSFPGDWRFWFNQNDGELRVVS